MIYIKIDLAPEVAREVRNFFNVSGFCRSISVAIKENGITEHNEVDYEVLQKPVIIFTNNGELVIDVYELSKLNDIIDDSVFEYLQNAHMKKNQRAFDYKKLLEDKISKETPEVVFMKIKHGEYKEDIYNKDYVLYYLLNNFPVQDIGMVTSFLDDSFDIKYSDLILRYTLPKKYVDAFIDHKEMNPVVLTEYLSRTEELPSVEDILKQDSLQVVDEYYFKLIGREGNDYDAFRLIKAGRATEKMIMDCYNRYEFHFTFDTILSLENLPESIFLEAVGNPYYQIYILNNESISSERVEVLYKYVQNNEILDKILSLEVTPRNIKQEILLKRNLINNLGDIQDLYKVSHILFEEDMKSLEMPFQSIEGFAKLKEDVENINMNKNVVLEFNQVRTEEADATVMLDNITSIMNHPNFVMKEETKVELVGEATRTISMLMTTGKIDDALEILKCKVVPLQRAEKAKILNDNLDKFNERQLTLVQDILKES